MRKIFRVVSALLAAVAFAAPPAGPVVADSPDSLKTIHPVGGIPNYASRDTFIVVGKRVTLREIIRRAVAGERGKLSGHHDMTYTMTGRSIVYWKDKKKVEEAVLRAYSDADGNHRTVRLEEKITDYKRDGEEWVEKKDDEKDPSPVRVSAGGVEEFSHIAFFLEEEHEFDFALLERVLEGDNVIFKIAFRPKSDFKPFPSGIVYIETPSYRIMHEEFQFKKNPFPLLLKGVDRVSRHWTVLPGGECVFNKIMVEAEIRSDPFGFMPYKISAVLMRDDFQFDQGYDERLFGELDNARALADTTRHAADRQPPSAMRGMIGRLQQEDESLYSPGLLEVDTRHRERVVAQHDSLGLEGFESMMKRRAPLWRPRAGVSTKLVDYNRVEGLLAGLSAGLRGRADQGTPSLTVEGAYATGSKKFRHFEELVVPRVRARWRAALRLNYGDQVVPYGSNRPVANGLIALIGSRDDQDYMRREGGGGGLFVYHQSGMSAHAAYESHRVRSVSGTTDFSFGGEMEKFNAPIVEGRENAIVLGVGYDPQPGSRLDTRVEQRFAGGALGGDFEYSRTDARIRARHYVVGRHEVSLQLLYAATAADVPRRQLADVGGLTTVRGYRRRTLVGESSLAVRLEYLFPYDVLRNARIPLVSSLGPQLVPWADAARVWEGNSQDWIHSVGFGLQFFLGAFGRASNLRLDFSFPTASDAPDDFRLDVHLARGGM